MKAKTKHKFPDTKFVLLKKNRKLPKTHSWIRRNSF